ncbi:MAG TPA: SpoIIE family protein phosphatase [Candidatus Baltobacteraceae bacterium]
MKARILVADDSEGSRYVIATWLRRDGYDVIEASTGQEALEHAERGVDLIILDVNLPDMSGYVVCERVKAGTDNALPVLHVSATAITPSDRSEGLRRGADAYLVEPVDREVLLASVAALLRGASAERTARRLAKRLRQLNDATQALNEARTVEKLASVVAEQASALFERDAWVEIVVGGTRERAASRSGGGQPEEIDIAAAGASQQYTTAEFADGDGDRALLVVAPGEANSTHAEEDELVLSQFVRAAKTALRNLVVYDIERDIAVTLQQSLLPTVVPDVPNAQFAVRYRSSAEHAEVGGDFYDMFALRNHRLAFAVGDVVGHSLEAAAIMAQLRTGIRSYMLEGHSPASTLERLNAMLQRFHPGTSATVCCATYDWETGECEIANAGHPPALLIAGGTASFLPTGGTLLGITPVTRPPVRRRLDPGDLMLFYTDGLIERRGESLDTGFKRLLDAAARPPEDLEGFLDHVLSEVAPAKPGDDIALVALRRLVPKIDSRLTVSRLATDEAPSYMRAKAAQFFRAIGAPPAVAADMLLAISEAVTNVAEHAYPHAAGDVQMQISHPDPATVSIEVADTGAFAYREAQRDRSRGLTIIRGVARDVKIHRDGGTRIVMTFDVSSAS